MPSEIIRCLADTLSAYKGQLGVIQMEGLETVPFKTDIDGLAAADLFHRAATEKGVRYFTALKQVLFI